MNTCKRTDANTINGKPNHNTMAIKHADIILGQLDMLFYPSFLYTQVL